MRLAHLAISYEDKTILEESQMIIPDHQFTLIKGVSGCGKSSLLYRLALMSEDHDYTYIYNNEVIDIANEKTRTAFRHQHIAYVMQDPLLFEQSDVKGNILMHAAINGHHPHDEEIVSYLHQVHLTIPLDEPIMHLSGGQRQRLAIACALARNVDIIILDEPSSALDGLHEEELFHMLASSPLTVIMATHSTQADELCDALYEIKDHQLICHKCTHEEISHFQETSDDLFPLYFHYYLRLHRKDFLILTLILTLCLSLMQFSLRQADHHFSAMQESYYHLSDLAFMVTKTNQHLDEGLSPFIYQANTKVKPIAYHYTSALLDDLEVMAVPLLSKRNARYLSQKESPIALSYTLYQSLMKQGTDLDDLSITLEIDHHHYTYKGLVSILNDQKKSPYFKNNIPYLAIDPAFLKKLYKKYSIHSYVAYIYKEKNYDQFITDRSLIQKHYKVINFFTHEKEIASLIQMTQWLKIGLLALFTIIILILTLTLTLMYYHKHLIDDIKLSIEGLPHRFMLKVKSASTALQFIIALAIPILIAHNQAVISVFILLITYVITILVMNHTLSKLSIEKVLRS